MLPNSYYFVAYILTDTEAQALMDWIREIRFSYYKCVNLLAPSTFNTRDVMLRIRNVYCFGSNVLHFNKRWLMEHSSSSEAGAIADFLRVLKSDIDLSALERGFHLERSVFLEIANTFQMFCSKILVDADKYEEEV